MVVVDQEVDRKGRTTTLPLEEWLCVQRGTDCTIHPSVFTVQT